MQAHILGLKCIGRTFLMSGRIGAERESWGPLL